MNLVYRWDLIKSPFFYFNLEDEIINQLYPNPDNMTYEELLALEEQVGNVSKGLSKKEISVRYNIINIVYSSSAIF